MLERFVREYSGKAFQFAFRLCGNSEEAKEIVQEAFYKLLKGWTRYDGRRSLENWFLRILRNVYVDSMRQPDRRLRLSVAEASPGGTLVDPLEELCNGTSDGILSDLARAESRALVQAALDCLPREQKAILLLRDAGGWDYRRIAEVLDCPLGTVRSRLARARTAFKREILIRNGRL